MNKIPLVSVCMITYNHEKYIREAIEGVLMQECTFPIELIISEDCGSDNTRAIIVEYAQKYPEIIVADLPDKNRGMMANSQYNMSLARGKYIALCEGDDYWIDPIKLQKQVDFLEANPEYGMVHTDAKSITESGKIYNNINYGCSNGNNKQNFELIEDILCFRCGVRTATVVYRKKIYNETYNDNLKFRDKRFFMGDIQTWCSIASVSKVKYFDYESSVYFLSANSATRGGGSQRIAKFQLSSAELRMEYMKNYNFSLAAKKFFTNRYVKALSIAKSKGVKISYYYDYDEKLLTQFTKTLYESKIIVSFYNLYCFVINTYLSRMVKTMVKHIIKYKK